MKAAAVVAGVPAIAVRAATVLAEIAAVRVETAPAAIAEARAGIAEIVAIGVSKVRPRLSSKS